ncbi:MAG: universal stress protein, partial [Chloroflexi bacterium]|nr:universal stress protein [Chloroflexota bacterium]
SLLVVGRYGVHRTDNLDLGSTAENLLRLAPCHVLIVGGESSLPDVSPPQQGVVALPWTQEAAERLEGVPAFARVMARQAIEAYARRHGYAKVTPEVMAEARREMGM